MAMLPRWVFLDPLSLVRGLTWHAFSFARWILNEKAAAHKLGEMPLFRVQEASSLPVEVRVLRVL